MSGNSKENLPERPHQDDRAHGEDNPRALHVSVEHLHYQANDLAELRKLADSHPELAAKIVEQNDTRDRREHVSYRVGLAVSTMIAMAAIGGAAYIIASLGWWQALVFIAALLGVSHVLMVVLKGEWSETSWFGKMLSGKDKRPDA